MQTPLNYFGPFNEIQPIVRLSINQTEISGNGLKAITPDDGDGIFIMVGTSQFGFINASVTNNHFSGNANIDFVTQSFVTTKTPASGNALFNPATGGIAIGTTAQATFQPDPLARLALTLTGNVGNTIDVTRVGAFYVDNDPQKSIPGFYTDPSTGPFQFVTGSDVRGTNAQREPGTFNVGGTTIDGGALTIGGIWGTYAFSANPTTPDTVATTTPAPTGSWTGTNGTIINSGDFVGAQVTFLNGPDGGVQRILTATTNTTQTFTITQTLAIAPVPGNQFTVASFELAGVGQSTFVTDSGPSVLTHNTFATVVSDFGDQVVNANPNSVGAQFPFTWATVPLGSFGSPFP